MLKTARSAFLTTLCVMAFTAPHMVHAQSRQDVKEITSNIEKIEKQLNALQKRVFRDGIGTGVDLSGADEGGSAQKLLADIEVRLGTLDRQVRDMTGAYEEMDHRQARLEEQLELLRKDMDLRFQDAGNAVGHGKPALNTPGVSANMNVGRSVEGADVTVLDAPQDMDDKLRQAQGGQIASAKPEDKYGAAFANVRKGDFDAAEASLKAFLADYPQHELAGNAQYWLGETYYARKDYPRAASAFLTGFQDYGKGSKGPDSLLKLALSLFGMGKKDDACSALEELPLVYPKASDALITRTKTERERIGCK